ncbi:MAG: hypothetical protein MI924_20200 [Chloroflexales bacterium]|nr:hypothetical protein [Chloroflexales bacterium]
MKMVRWFGMFAVVLALVVFVAPQAAYAQSANVEPSVGPPGGGFAFAAEGFNAGEQVGVWLNNPDGAVSDIIDANGEIFVLFADDTGRADWSVFLANDAPSGFYQMVAFGVKSKVEIVIPFEVREGAPLPVNYTVEPVAGPSGTEFVFAAGGFLPNERLGVWTNNPDGTVSDILDANGDVFMLFADDDGVAVWSVFVQDIPGVYQMVVFGLESGVQVVIPFEVTP